MKHKCDIHGETDYYKLKPNVYICSTCWDYINSLKKIDLKEDTSHQSLCSNWHKYFFATEHAPAAETEKTNKIAWVQPYPYPHVKINNLEFVKAAFPIQPMPEGAKKIFYLKEQEQEQKEEKCHKCDGEGWLWWNELDKYSGPARKTGEDDTRYTCDACFKDTEFEETD